MKLYRAKIPAIAANVIETLITNGDLEVTHENRPEAEQDLVAIMENFSRRDFAFRSKVKDHMAERRIPYDQYGRTRGRLADEMGHPLGDDIERFLARQFVENMMISNFVEEVYGEDSELYKKIVEVLRSHHVDEGDIREEAESRVKNVRQGTVDYEIALQNAVRDVKKRRGLL
ncbi:MAG: DUF507 family protein [Proteobacteria bacterium]|nr:DUF507 family protein [Pseudomonadota bacterium]